MKATCNREDLLAAFQMVSGVVPARSPKPILLNVKFIGGNEGAVLLATDLEVGIRCKVTGVEVKTPGEVILPTARMLAILRESSDPTIELETDGSQTSVRGQRSRFKLPAESPTEFPDVPDFQEDKYHTIAGVMLRTMIRRTIFATDVETTR